MEKGRARMLRWAVIAHVAITVGALVSLRAFGEHARPTFFLLYMPRQPFAVGAIVLLSWAIVAKRPRLVALEMVALLLALFPLMGLRLGHAEKARGPSMRLLTYNVFYERIDEAALTREIAAANADFIVLQAARTSYVPKLEAALPGFHVRGDDELVLASRHDFWMNAPEPWPDVRQSWIRCGFEGPTGRFEVVNVHPVSARAGLFDRAHPSVANALRERQITAATAAALRSGDPVIVAGDTNLPEPSAIARKAFAPFHDAFADVGFGFGYTFPAKYPWMRIDRVLGSARVRFLDVRVMPRGASDHRAVVVDFEILPP
jgi:vancomycin resistance protein VanJ